MEDFKLQLVDEIVSACANIEVENNCSIDYVGLSYDAYLQIKNEIEDGFDRPITASDINKSLSIAYVILPGLYGIDYKFLKEVRFED